MYGETKNNKKLRVRLVLITRCYVETDFRLFNQEIYEKSLRVRSAIPHPRIQGVIRECGGKMYMSESKSVFFTLSQGCADEGTIAEDWEKAQVDFFESFRSYDEAGSPERVKVLKYLVLAHMLMDSSIDPFDSQETKP